MINGNIGSTKVLLKEVVKKESTTKSGIIISAIAKDPQITGDIIQIGSAVLADPDGARVNERVLFYPHAAQRFNIGDEPVMLLDCKEILFRFTPAP
jgi:co-chaperonin GroES (HSP10)